MGHRPAAAQAGAEIYQRQHGDTREQNVSVVLIVSLAIYYGEIGQNDFTSRTFWAFFLAGAVGASFGKVFYYKGIDKVGPAALLSPVWRISPLVTFALAHLILRGIEVVTVRDGVAASFIVAGVYVLSQG